MALTFNTSDMPFFLRTPDKLTYSKIEAAVNEAGLTDVDIARNKVGDEYEIQLFIHSGTPGEMLPAEETLQALSEIVAALNEQPPAE